MGNQSPIVRVEIEYANGKVQSLAGPPAEAWLEDVVNLTTAWATRYGRCGADYPWKWSTKATSSPPPAARVSFEHYDGTD